VLIPIHNVIILGTSIENFIYTQSGWLSIKGLKFNMIIGKGNLINKFLLTNVKGNVGHDLTIINLTALEYSN
jgi:hypothetical protein